jgi:predicted transcriptional regulator
MTVGEQIELIKRHNEVLKQLLDDPHPGLITWMDAVGHQLDAIAALAPSYRKVER